MLYFLGDSDSVKPPGKSGFGNPSSIHRAGRSAKVAMDDAREFIQTEFDFESTEEFIFTGSGTESINTAIKGAFFHALQNKRDFHLFTTRAEHEATLQSANFVESLGAKVHWLELDREGQISPEQLEQAVAEVRGGSGADRDVGPAVLFSFLAVNNETGLISDISAISGIAQKHGALFHLDAVQAAGKLPAKYGAGKIGRFSIRESGADMVSISAHKIGGPKGIGGLYLKQGLKIEALLSGGAQERKRRAGTQNVAAAVGFGEAARILSETDFENISQAHQRLEKGILDQVEGLHIVGATKDRAINTTNIIVEGVRGDSLLMALDLEGIAVSAGSACNSGTVQPSHVLLAMGYSKEEALSTVRISLGADTTKDEIDYVLEVLPKVITRIRASKRN